MLEGLGTLPVRYLGLPLKKGKMLKTDWILIIENMERRLEMAGETIVKG